MPHGRSATRDPHRGPTQGSHSGDPHRGPAQGTHTGDPHTGDGPTEDPPPEGRAAQGTHTERTQTTEVTPGSDTHIWTLRIRYSILVLQIL